MTVNLAHLRRLAEECRDAHTWKQQPDGSKTCSWADAEDVALRLGTRANEILEVLDRLERAESKEDLSHDARVARLRGDGPTVTDRMLGLLEAYFRNDDSDPVTLVTDLVNDRDTWRARATSAEQKLAEHASVYPTLMTQVGKERP